MNQRMSDEKLNTQIQNDAHYSKILFPYRNRVSEALDAFYMANIIPHLDILRNEKVSIAARLPEIDRLKKSYAELITDIGDAIKGRNDTLLAKYTQFREKKGREIETEIGDNFQPISLPYIWFTSAVDNVNGEDILDEKTEIPVDRFNIFDCSAVITDSIVQIEKEINQVLSEFKKFDASGANLLVSLCEENPLSGDKDAKDCEFLFNKAFEKFKYDFEKNRTPVQTLIQVREVHKDLQSQASVINGQPYTRERVNLLNTIVALKQVTPSLDKLIQQYSVRETKEAIIVTYLFRRINSILESNETYDSFTKKMKKITWAAHHAKKEYDESIEPSPLYAGNNSAINIMLTHFLREMCEVIKKCNLSHDANYKLFFESHPIFRDPPDRRIESFKEYPVLGYYYFTQMKPGMDEGRLNECLKDNLRGFNTFPKEIIDLISQYTPAGFFYHQTHPKIKAVDAASNREELDKEQAGVKCGRSG